jgi:PAS domain S-box-containing protein
MTMFYLELVQNVGLLVSLVVIHGQIIRRWNKYTLTSQVFSGFLFGCVALIGMMTPVNLMPGLIFDGRSIVLSVAGLFGGPVTAGIAAIMSAAYRLWLGGPGVIMGVSVILESAGLGVAFYYLRPLYPGLTRNLYLFGFGLLVHVGMLLLTLALPREAMLKTLENMTIPVLLIFPAATWLICLLFLDQESRISAEENVHRNETFLQQIVENIPDMIFVKEAENLKFVRFNKAGEDLLGYSREDLLGKNDYDFFSPSQAEFFIAKDREVLRNGKLVEIPEEEINTRLKGNRILHTKKIPILNSEGKAQFLLGISEDITERKKTEEQLQRNEEKYQKLYQDAPLMYVITQNEQGFPFISDCNKLFLRSMGFAREDVIGKPLADFYLPESRARLLEGGDYARALAGEYVMGERQLVTRDCRLIHTLLYTMPETDFSGHVTGTRAMFVDITAERKAEEAQSRLATAVEQAADAIIITDSAGTIQYVNRAQEMFSGYSIDELVGQTPNVLKIDFHDGDFYKQLWDTIGVGKVWSGRFVNKKKDGTEYHEDATISPIYDKSGNLTNFVVVEHDVTEQLALQEQLFQAQKMEAIGTLAGGFAHDFNNKLQVIAGYVELILFNKDIPESARSEMEVIQQTVQSSAELIKGMMVFSRKTPAELQPVELNKLVAQTVSMLIRSMPKMIEIDLLLADDLWAINAVANQIDQILMNLAINARDAMPYGGKVTIKTNNIVLDEEYCRFVPNTKPGRYALITVSDTGFGMNKETASRIFEPFFTTKEAGKGTGLGLSVVYGIVQQHGGKIICHSEPSVGTTFRIYFPAIEED